MKPLYYKSSFRNSKMENIKNIIKDMLHRLKKIEQNEVGKKE